MKKEMDPAPDPQARFAAPDGPFRMCDCWQPYTRISQIGLTGPAKLLSGQIVRLGVFATPEVTQADFMKACSEAGALPGMPT